MVPLLAGFIRQWQEQAPYGRLTDWVFASNRLKGKRPRVANMLGEDYLRPAAVKAGVVKEGEKVRFGFHKPTQEMFDKGQILSIVITPVRDLPDGFQSQPGTPAPALD